MSEKLLRPWIRLVMLFYTFPLPSHFSIFFLFFFFSLGLCHVPRLSVEMSRYWSHLKSVCMCVTLCACVPGTSCIFHAFALSVTMLSGAYLTGLNPCPPWPIASTPTGLIFSPAMKSRTHLFSDPLSHKYRGLRTTLNLIQLRWVFETYLFAVKLLADSINWTVAYSLI